MSSIPSTAAPSVSGAFNRDVTGSHNVVVGTSNTAHVNVSHSSASHVSLARSVVRDHFAALQQQLREQEVVAVSALEAHVRERLCSIRQQHEDLASLISQVNMSLELTTFSSFLVMLQSLGKLKFRHCSRLPIAADY